MTIDELNALSTLTAGDEIPVWDSEESGESTKKITAQNMTTSVKTLGNLVNTSEMNDALADKQNTLTFDTTPTTGSTNPVTSDGIKTAIAQSTAIIMQGNASYSNLKQGGYSGRVTITVNFPKAMPDTNYFATAELSDAYADFTTISCYVFNRTTTSIDVVLVNMASGSATSGGVFRWMAIRPV